MIAKYYFSKEKSIEELTKIVKGKMLEFNIDGYQEYRYHNKIQKVCQELYDYESENLFRELEFIPIYENELKVIESLPNDRQKKFLFTVFAIARYMDCGGWINKKDSKGLSEVFKLANVSLTYEKRNELLHELYSNGYIYLGKKIDNLNIRVDLDDSGEIVYKVKDFENIGNQYIGNFKKGYKQCSNPGCGRKIRIKSKNDYSTKYCPKCAKEIKQKQVNECKKRRKVNLE